MILIGFNENAAHATISENESATPPRNFVDFSLVQSLGVFEAMQADELTESIYILKLIFNNITGRLR